MEDWQRLRKCSKTFFERFHARLPAFVASPGQWKRRLALRATKVERPRQSRGMFIDVAWPATLFRCSRLRESGGTSNGKVVIVGNAKCRPGMWE